jgi:hypothetical protein
MSTLDSLTDNSGSKDNGESPSSDGGKDVGEALSKFDFSQIDVAPHTNLGSQGLDYSDVHAALASMSSEDALDYAISHIGAADLFDASHSDAGHSDGYHLNTATETSHDA